MDPSPQTQLLALCAYLRKRDLRIEADQVIVAAWLVRRQGLSLDGDPAALARLAGIFCKSAADQDRFATLTADWLAGKGGKQAIDPLPGAKAVELKRRTSSLRELPRWLWTVFYAACGLAILAGYAWYQFERERAFNVMVVVRKGADQSFPLRDVTITGARCESADAELGMHVCRAPVSAFPLMLTVTNPELRAAPVEAFADYPLWRALDWSGQLSYVLIQVEKNDAPPAADPGKTATITITGSWGKTFFLPAPPTPGQGNSLAVTLGAIALLFLALFVAGLAWMRHAATVARGRGPLAPRTLSLQGGSQIRPFKNWMQAMQAYALSLRQPERGYGTRLDARKTVDASARKAGLFAPVYGGARERRFLAFVRRESRQDHEAFMGEALIAELFRCGADVLAFRFDGDANVVEPYTPLLRDGQKPAGNERACFPTMDQVLAENEQAECLVFCEPLAMTNPISGELADWSAKLVARSPRCTVFSLGRGGPDDRTRFLLDAAGARLSCFDADALHALGNAAHGAQARQGTPAVMPRALGLAIQLRRKRPRQVEVDALCAAMGEYLGPTGLRWVQACAIYPDVNWALTNAVGCALVSDERERERLLFRLSQMVWFRHAYMPDWLRSELASKLTPSEQSWLRDFYWDLFDQPQGSDNIGLSVAEGGPGALYRMRLLLQRARARLGVRTALRTARDHEQIYLRFLLGRPVSPLALTVPRRIMAALSDATRTPRNALAALCVTGAAVSLLWALSLSRGADALPMAQTVSVGFGKTDERLVVGAAVGPDLLLMGIFNVQTGLVGAPREIKRSVLGSDSEGVAVVPEMEGVISLAANGIVFSDVSGDMTKKYDVNAGSGGQRWLAIAPDAAAGGALPQVHVTRLSDEKIAFTYLYLPQVGVPNYPRYLSDSRVKRAQGFAFDAVNRLILMGMDNGTAAVRLDESQLRISRTTEQPQNAGKLLRVAAADNYFAECWESGLVRLWRSDSFTMRFERKIGSDSPCTALAIMPLNEQLAVGTANGLVVLVGRPDAKIDMVATSYNGKAAVASIAFDANFKRIGIARKDLSISVVDLNRVEPAPSPGVPAAAADSPSTAAASAASKTASVPASASTPSAPAAGAKLPAVSPAAPSIPASEASAGASSSPSREVDRVPAKRIPTTQQDVANSLRESHFGDDDPAQPVQNDASRVVRPAQEAVPAPNTDKTGNDSAAAQKLLPSSDLQRRKTTVREIPRSLDLVPLRVSPSKTDARELPARLDKK
jgi:hypothetical protein